MPLALAFLDLALRGARPSLYGLQKANIKPYYNYIRPNYNQLNEWPLQFLRTGSYNRFNGNLGGRTSYSAWWSGTVFSTHNGRHLASMPGEVYTWRNNPGGYGFALRCVAY